MSDERKTFEQRAQMRDLERLRHSTSHVLATAILRLWPEPQFAAGSPVENLRLCWRGAALGIVDHLRRRLARFKLCAHFL